jgi:nitroreductase
MNNVIDLLNNHRSIRKFTDKPISQETINTLIQAGQAAPTSSFIQACSVIQVNDPVKRQELVECTGGQAYVAQAPVFLVFCADTQRLKLACEMNDAEMNSGFTEQFITATVDVALVAQNVAIAAQSIGLGICYIGGIRNQISQVSKLLELPNLVYPVFGLCLGYPNQNPEVKPRLPLDVVLKQDSYDDSKDQASIAEYDNSVSEYYRTRTGGNKDMTWSAQMSDMLVKEARPHMRDFLQEKGFLLK